MAFCWSVEAVGVLLLSSVPVCNTQWFILLLARLGRKYVAYNTVDDVEDDEEDGDGGANDGQSDEDPAEKVLADAASLAASGPFAVAARVLGHRLYRHRVQLLRTLRKKKKNKQVGQSSSAQSEQ